MDTQHPAMLAAAAPEDDATMQAVARALEADAPLTRVDRIRRELEAEARSLVMAARMHGFAITITGTNMLASVFPVTTGTTT